MNTFPRCFICWTTKQVREHPLCDPHGNTVMACSWCRKRIAKHQKEGWGMVRLKMRYQRGFPWKHRPSPRQWVGCGLIGRNLQRGRK